MLHHVSGRLVPLPKFLEMTNLPNLDSTGKRTWSLHCPQTNSNLIANIQAYFHTALEICEEKRIFDRKVRFEAGSGIRYREGPRGKERKKALPPTPIQSLHEKTSYRKVSIFFYSTSLLHFTQVIAWISVRNGPLYFWEGWRWCEYFFQPQLYFTAKCIKFMSLLCNIFLCFISPCTIFFFCKGFAGICVWYLLNSPIPFIVPAQSSRADSFIWARPGQVKLLCGSTTCVKGVQSLIGDLIKEQHNAFSEVSRSWTPWGRGEGEG